MIQVFDKQTVERLSRVHDAVASNPLMLGGSHFGGACEPKAAIARKYLERDDFDGGVVAIVPSSPTLRVIPTDIYGQPVSHRLAPEEVDETQGQRPWQEVGLRWNYHVVAVTPVKRSDGGSEIVAITPSECSTPVRLTLYLATMVAQTGIQWRYFSSSECSETYTAAIDSNKVRIGIEANDANLTLKEVRARLHAIHKRHNGEWKPPATHIKLRDLALTKI